MKNSFVTFCCCSLCFFKQSTSRWTPENTYWPFFPSLSVLLAMGWRFLQKSLLPVLWSIIPLPAMVCPVFLFVLLVEPFTLLEACILAPVAMYASLTTLIDKHNHVEMLFLQAAV